MKWWHKLFGWGGPIRVEESLAKYKIEHVQPDMWWLYEWSEFNGGQWNTVSVYYSEESAFDAIAYLKRREKQARKDAAARLAHQYTEKYYR